MPTMAAFFLPDVLVLLFLTSFLIGYASNNQTEKIESALRDVPTESSTNIESEHSESLKCDVPKSVVELCTGSCTTNYQEHAMTDCDQGYVFCLSSETCIELPTSLNIYSNERYCAPLKVYCLDFQRCLNADPVYAPVLRSTTYSPFKCSLGLKLCAESGTCSYVNHQNFDDEKTTNLDTFHCSLASDEILFESSTCSHHSDCPGSSKCCADAGLKKQCVPYNWTSPQTMCPDVPAHLRRSSELCTGKNRCPGSKSVCCRGICYDEPDRLCPLIGTIYCDVTNQCIDILTGSCGLSCPPPLGFCPGFAVCVERLQCSQGFNGGKAWTVMPLAAMTLNGGFSLEDVWLPLRYTKGSFDGLLRVIDMNGSGQWETYDTVWLEWRTLQRGDRLAASAVLRVDHGDVPYGIAELVLDDADRVHRKLIHYLPPTAVSSQMSQRSPRSLTLSIEDDGSHIFDIGKLMNLQESVDNSTDLDQFWLLIESKVSSLDLSSTVLKNAYRFKVDRSKSVGWTVRVAEPTDRYDEIPFTADYSFDSGSSWLPMDLSRVTAFADSEFWLRVATTADRRDGSRLRLVLAPLLGQKADELSRIEIVANMQYRPSRCRSEVELDRLPSDWWNNTDNNGVEVGQLAALFYETDEANVLALMILIAAWKSSLGRWQWASPGDGEWTDVDLPSNPFHRFVGRMSTIGCIALEHFNHTGQVEALLVPADHRLRFATYVQGRSWTRRDAVSGAGLLFAASVNATSTVPQRRNVSSATLGGEVNWFFMSHVDCTGLPVAGGAPKRVDVCGVCGGDNSSCQVTETCVERDCAFQCKPLNEEDDSVCWPKGSRIASVRCESGSFVNKCGLCVAQSNASRGTSPCGTCADRDDRSCFQPPLDGPVRLLIDWHPSIIDLFYGNRHTVSVRVTDATSSPSKSECLLTSVNGTDIVAERVVSRRDRLWLTLIVVHSGTYSARCTWTVDGAAVLFESTQQMLTVVDSRLVGADWVIPKRVSVSEPITVNLSLSMDPTLVDAARLQCAYQPRGQSVAAVPVLAISDDTVQCRLPLDLAVETGVTLVASPWPTGWNVEPRLVLQVTAPAPIVVFARLNSRLDRVAIRFDQNVDGPSQCALLFAPTTVLATGKRPLCIFHDNQLTVFLGPSHRICSGSRLTFATTNVIRRRGSTVASGAPFAGGDVFVASTKEAIQFDAIAILGPSSVCSAGAVLYRVAGLNEIHRTNMTITWSLLRSNDTVPVVSDESTPDQIIFDASLTEPTDVNRLSATVDAQLCNGRYILTASINIRRSDVASVAVSGPTWVRPNRQYVFTALVDLCRPAPALGYEWSVNGTGVASRSNGPRIDLPARLSSDAWYRLTCRIDAGASSVEAELLFYVEEAAVQVQITPTVQSIGPEGFGLDGSVSEAVDPTVQLLWRCRRRDGEGCFVARAVPLRRLEQFVGLARLQQARLTIDDVLPPGDYVFTLAAQKRGADDVWSESDADVIVAAEARPQIFVRTTPDVGLVSARVRCVAPCRAFWAVDRRPGTNFESVDDDAFLLGSDSTPTPTSTLTVALLLPGAVAAAPDAADARFSFRLRVEHLDDPRTSAIATVDIHRNAVPFGGQLVSQLSNSSDDGLTVMELQAVGWRDQTGDLPLIYRFGYRRADSRADAIVWLTAPSHQPAASVVVPLAAGNRLIPLAAVCDTRLGCAMIESTALAPEQDSGGFSCTDVVFSCANLAGVGRHYDATSSVGAYLSVLRCDTDAERRAVEDVLRPGLSHYQHLDYKGPQSLIRLEAIGYLALATDATLALRRRTPKSTRLARDLLVLGRHVLGFSDRIDLDHLKLRLKLTELSLSMATASRPVRFEEMLADLVVDCTCRRPGTLPPLRSETLSLWTRRIIWSSTEPRRLLAASRPSASTPNYVDLTGDSASGAVCLNVIEMDGDPLTAVGQRTTGGDRPPWRRASVIAYVGVDDWTGNTSRWTVTSVLRLRPSIMADLIDGWRWQCLAWLPSTAQWSDRCTTTHPSVSMTSDHYVDCTCDRPQFHAVFLISTAPASPLPVTIRWIDTDTDPTADRSERFVSHLCRQLSSMLNISVRVFAQPRLERAGVFLCDMTPSSGVATAADVQQAYHRLQQLLLSDRLYLVDLNGEPLNFPSRVDSIGSDYTALVAVSALSGVALLLGLASISFQCYRFWSLRNKWWRRNATVPARRPPRPRSFLFPNEPFRLEAQRQAAITPGKPLGYSGHTKGAWR